MSQDTELYVILIGAIFALFGVGGNVVLQVGQWVYIGSAGILIMILGIYVHYKKQKN